jgi:RimJ/RimL family protein N-acetyltransferase
VIARVASPSLVDDPARLACLVMRGRWPVDQPVLAAGRLLLRPWRAGDIDEVFRACQDPDIQHFTRVPTPYRLEHAEGFVAGASRQWADGSGAPFAVTDPITGQLIGSVGLMQADHQRRRTEAGYWTAPWGRSHGHTRAALHAATRWALTEGGFETVTLQVEQDNLRSAVVAAAVGYRRVNVPVEQVMLKGTVRAFVSYQVGLSDLR